MRPITGDCACGRFFLHPRKGPLRVRCDECRRTLHARKNRSWDAQNPDRVRENHAAWYIANRKNNPEWREINKKRAKAWRAANKQHIRLYKQTYRELRA